jgi:hypothetical protein
MVKLYSYFAVAMNTDLKGSFQVWDMNKNKANTTVSGSTSMITNIRTLFDGRSLAVTRLYTGQIQIGQMNNKKAYSVKCSISVGATVDFLQTSNTNLISISQQGTSYSLKVWDIKKCNPEIASTTIISLSTAQNSTQLFEKPLFLRIINDNLVVIASQSRIEIRDGLNSNFAKAKYVIRLETGTVSDMHVTPNNLFVSDSNGNIFSYSVSTDFTESRKVSAYPNFLVIDDDKIVSWNKNEICTSTFTNPDSKDCFSNNNNNLFIDLQLARFNNDGKKYLIGSLSNVLKTNYFLKVIDLDGKAFVDEQQVLLMNSNIQFYLKIVQLNENAFFNPSK